MNQSPDVKDHLFIIFAKEHYNPLGIVRTLGRAGINPVFIALRGKGPASTKSKYIREVRYIENKEEGLRILLNEYVDQKNKPFLITSDDDAQSFLDMHYSELKDHFIFFNAGEDGRITKYMDKEEVLRIAEKHGLTIPKTVVVDHGTIPEDIVYPVITKSISPNVGGWKSDVHICHSPDELREAYDHILSPQVLLQRFIDKENEYCMEGISVQSGKEIAIPMAIKYNYVIQGYYSPYMTAYPTENTELVQNVKAMMEDIGFEGLFDVEFLIDKDGTYYFTEINFRNSIWNYIGEFAGMPYPILWAEGMLSGKLDQPCLEQMSGTYTAMTEPIDYGIRVVKGNTSRGEWLADFRKTDVLFYYDDEDREPFYEMVDHWEVYR